MTPCQGSEKMKDGLPRLQKAFNYDNIVQIFQVKFIYSVSVARVQIDHRYFWRCKESYRWSPDSGTTAHIEV